MKTIIETLRCGWDTPRVIRVLVGLAVLLPGAVQGDSVLLFFGAWLTLLPLLNLSCCGAGGCDVNHSKPKQVSDMADDKIKNFDEVK